jgi:hypothetical protein
MNVIMTKTVLVTAITASLVLAGCDVEQTDKGSMPEVDVKVEKGQLPKYEVTKTQEGKMPKVDVDVKGGDLPDYDVDMADVDIGTKEVDVTVPDVDVKMKEKTITVPDVDVDMPDDEEIEEDL